MADAVQTPRLSVQERMRAGPILPTLISFAAPNLIALGASTVISIAETAYVGRLGVPSLAGVALVFPVIMLMQMMSGGAMGGGISGAVSRALGAGDAGRAQSLALCAVVIGLVGGAGFALFFSLMGPTIYRVLGGEGASLREAIAYSGVASLGVFAIWMTNSMASVARGTGNMAAPALVVLLAGALQITVGGALGLGLGPLPQLGVAGVAAGQVVGFTVGACVLAALLRSPRSRVRLTFSRALLRRDCFADILRVGLPGTLSPIQSVGTILILTALVARFGPEALAGYGIGARLEFLLIPIAFSIGIACLPMVGTAIGAGDVARARAVAWTAGGLATLSLAVIAGLVMIAPDLWARLFVHDERVLEVTRTYLRVAGFGFPFFGLGLCLYFASQGAGKIAGPILSQGLRLAIVAVGGYFLARAEAPLWTLFALAAVAMAALGLGTAFAVRVTRWGDA